MTTILLRSSEAVRHGFYLTPLSFTGWNPIPLTHGNRFVRRGKPLWDKGRGHDEFLHDIYLMCKPYANDVYERVSLGSSIADEIATRFDAVAPAIESHDTRDAISSLVRHTRALMAVNRDYVHTILSYFAYREKASDDNLGRLKSDVHSLEVSVTAYRADHHAYDLAGIDLTIELANRMLANREQAEQTLRNAPTLSELATKFSQAAAASQKLLAEAKNIVPVMTWSGTLDGSALLVIRGKDVEVQNLDYNPVTHARSQFLYSLSRKSKAQWVVRPKRGRGVFYLADTPSSENNYTARVYLEDPAPGSDVFELELCRIDLDNGQP